MVTIPRRNFLAVCLTSPFLCMLTVGCEQTDQMIENAKQTAIAAVQQTAEAELQKHLPSLPQLPELPKLPSLPSLPNFSAIFGGLPMKMSKWNNGFGAIQFAKTHTSLYADTSGLHGGIDFGNDANTSVIAQVSGKIVDTFPNDAKPNVVVQVGNYFVLYGHTKISDTLSIGKEVSPDTEIGKIIFQENDNHHLHLSVRIGDRSYNPLYFFNKSDVEDITWTPYVSDENAWSMKSFLYKSTKVANYWDNKSNPNLGIER